MSSDLKEKRINLEIHKSLVGPHVDASSNCLVDKCVIKSKFVAKYEMWIEEALLALVLNLAWQSSRSRLAEDSI